MAENKKSFPGFIGGSYQDNNPRYDSQRTVNYYSQQDESLNGKDRAVTELLQRPGLNPLQNIGAGPIRQMYTLSNGTTAIVVSGNQIYSISSGNAVPVNIAGTMATSAGYVSIEDNDGYIIVVDGVNGYSWHQGDTSFTTFVPNSVAQPNFYAANQVTYQDGFFVFSIPDSNAMFISNNCGDGGTSGDGGGPITFSDSNYANKQGYADPIVGCISNARELFVFGYNTTEVWYDAGTSIVFSFQREDGKNSQTGCISAGTIVRLAGTMFWLGRNPQGGAMVYFMNGYSPQRVSTHAIEYQLSQLGDLSQSVAFGMQYNGHYFYVLQCPGSKTTWVYDISAISDVNPQTGLWTEWQSTTAYNAQGQFLGGSHCYLNGQHLMGDMSSGAIYLWDETYCQDNGLTLRRERTSPHVAKDLNNVFYKLLQIDFNAGQGLVNNGSNTANAVNPQAILEYSDDGGENYGPPIYTQLGAIGKYYTRARWQQLGVSRDRVFKVTVTDPVVAHMIEAKLDVEVGYE